MTSMPAAADTLLLGVVGSTAYGLAHADSDQDRLGVFRAPTTDVLGLAGAAATDRSHVSHEPDVTVHELGKFARLALKGNPTVLELLYLPRYDILSPEGQQLLDLRDAFLSRTPVQSAYFGYARQQAERLRARHAAGGDGFSSSTAARTAKHGRHCLRLLRQGFQLLTTGTLTLDVSAQRDELFAAGDLAVSDPDAFYAMFVAEADRLDTAVSVLPEHPDTDAVNDFVVRTRLAALR